MVPDPDDLRPPAVGVDVATVSRVAAVMARTPRLVDRVFTDAEQRDSRGHAQRWATRWAAKEAVRKLAGALGVAPLPAWRDIEVLRVDGGAPTVRVPGIPAAVALSLSHDGDVAVAVAVSAGVHQAAGTPASPPPQDLRLPERPADGHKGTFGTAVVLAGSHGFSGAAYLAAMGAARGGAGLVRLCVPESLHAAMAVKCVEVMPHPLPDEGRGVVGGAAVERLLEEHLPRADVLVAGPGLGQDPQTEEAIASLLTRLPCATVVDADGLNIAARRGVDWRAAGHPVVLTPHPAEMGRLCGIATAAVQADRLGLATRYAAERGAVVVLKGSETVVAAPDGRTHVAPYRLPALGTGGSGDVLAGLCGAMLAAGLDPYEGAVAAVIVHGEAGAAVQAERGRAGVLASDLLEALPAAQERLRRVLERRR